MLTLFEVNGNKKNFNMKFWFTKIPKAISYHLLEVTNPLQKVVSKKYSHTRILVTWSKLYSIQFGAVEVKSSKIWSKVRKGFIIITCLEKTFD